MTGKKGRWTKGAKQTAPRERQRPLDYGEEVDENDSMQSAQPLPVENKLFEEYYVNQGVLSQDEVEKFMEYTKKPLPLSFRLAMDKSTVRELVRVMKRDFFSKMTEIGPEGGVLQQPTNIPWVSDETVWEMQFDEKKIAECKILQDFKTFLYQEILCGNIIQQDVASMLPACLLDVKPHHKVLDLRASPGHRAVHLVQLLHSDEKVPIPDGVVIANETHLKRCFSMCDQIKQYFSPNFATVNMDANSLPSLFLSADKDPKPLVYDRIVCGLPSSGDGMFRNNLDGLRCWTANMPLSHHGHLTQMLYSGMSSLEIGGRLVFFTYSMNPVEAEAVAYAVIMQQRGTVELVDVSQEMPSLIYEKGLHTWRVMAKGPRWFREYEEVPEHLQTMVWPSMFPPSKEEAERVGLDRCIRILPHKQNTVGLFVAAFTRKSSVFEAYQREQEEQQKAYEAAEEARRLEEAKLLEEKEKKKLEEEEKRKKKLEEEEKKKKLEEEEKKKKLEEEEKKKKLEEEEKKKKLEEEEKKKKLEEEEKKKKLEEEEKKKKLEEKEKKKKKETEEKAKESEKKDKVEDLETVEGKEAEEKKSEKNAGEDVEKNAEEGVEKNAEDGVEKNVEEGVEKNAEKGVEKNAEEGVEKNAEVVVVEDGKGEEKSEVVLKKVDEYKEGTAKVDETKEEENAETEEESGRGRHSKNGFEDDYGDEGNGAAVAEDEGGNNYSNAYQEEDGGVKGGDADDSRRSRIEGQFEFLDANDKIWIQLKDFFGISDDFPYMRMACRPVSGLKLNFVLVADTIKKVVENNQSLYSFVHIGVKLFTYMKQPNVACCYRLAIEGLSTILPYMTKRIVTVSKRDFVAILSSHNPTVEGLTVKTKKEVTNLDKGAFAFVLEPDRAKNSHKCQVIVSAWKDEDTAYRTFIPAYQRLHYLRVGGANMNDYDDHPETPHDVDSAMAAFAKSFPL